MVPGAFFYLPAKRTLRRGAGVGNFRSRGRPSRFARQGLIWVAAICPGTSRGEVVLSHGIVAAEPTGWWRIGQGEQHRVGEQTRALLGVISGQGAQDGGVGLRARCNGLGRHLVGAARGSKVLVQPQLSLVFQGARVVVVCGECDMADSGCSRRALANVDTVAPFEVV